MERRLAAILAADVVGYSRLMEQDEAGALAALKERRKTILAPLVAQHHGRIIKVMGDGVLVEFGSAVDAVACAVELQRRMAEANADLPVSRAITLRIGVNLGDVIVEGSDLYGEGVNIAARLEALAEPGGICVSGTVHEHVQRRLPLAFEDLHEQTLKNIARPVRVYRATDAGRLSVLSAAATTEKPTIAVLPFINMSGDPEQEYFSDGITEDIITELSRFRSIFVIARNSSFAYKGKPVKVQEIARTLDVAYVVEGSVRKIAPRIRITAQLIDATSGKHLWAERYDQNMHDIFAIQDDVVAKIVARVAGQIAAAGSEKVRRKRTASLAAYEYLLRGLEYYSSDDLLDLAHDMFRNAIAGDPNFAWAHALLAFVDLQIYWRDFYKSEPTQGGLDRAFEAATRAVSLDGNDSECHRALAQILVYRRSFEPAKRHLDMAETLNPNNVGIATTRAWFEIYTGRPQAALETLDRAERLDPQFPNWYWEARGQALYQLRRYEEAAAAFERMSAPPLYVDQWRASCYAQSGRTEDARAIATEVLNREPRFTLRRYAMIEPFQSQASLDHLIEGMRKAGLPE
jgi:adenylate cyclase